MSNSSNKRLHPQKRTEAIGVDIASSIIAACAVAPGITIVDKGKFLSNDLMYAFLITSFFLSTSL